MATNPNLTEPLGRFRSDLVVEPQKKDGAVGAYRVVDPISNVSHVLTEIEYAVATCMNGERNALAICRHAARLGHPVQADHVERFHRELEGLSFVYRDQPPTLTRPPDTSHRDDAKRFVEEAKRELALGRIEVARDLLDAALAIDRVAATDAATEATPAPANPSDALGPVLDYLKDWDVPVPPPTFDALPAIDINLDDGVPIAPIARKRSNTGRWLAAAAVVAVAAGVGAATDFTFLPSGVLAFPEALASTPTLVIAPPPPVIVALPPVVATPPVAPIAVPEIVATDATKTSDTNVVAPAKGRFARALVMSGLKVKVGQRVAILALPHGKQMVLTAPAAGIFEATAALGKTVGKGDVVGVVHAW